MARRERALAIDEDQVQAPEMQTREPSETLHLENQERAYVAASRRADRSLEARYQSALMASRVHRKRTGRTLRVTHQIVHDQDVYEEDCPAVASGSGQSAGWPPDIASDVIACPAHHPHASPSSVVGLEGGGGGGGAGGQGRGGAELSVDACCAEPDAWAGGIAPRAPATSGGASLPSDEMPAYDFNYNLGNGFEEQILGPGASNLWLEDFVVDGGR